MPKTSHRYGPVEWVAITFPGTVLDAAVATPIAELVEAKTVRLLDAAVVHKAADGTVTEGELADETSAFDDVDGDVLELLSHDDLTRDRRVPRGRHHDARAGLGEPVGERLRRCGARARRQRARVRPRAAGRRRRCVGARKGAGHEARTRPRASRARAAGHHGPHGRRGGHGVGGGGPGRRGAGGGGHRDRQAAAAQEELRQVRMQAEVETQVADALRAEAAAPAPTARRSTTCYAQLTKLGELREAGLLTEAEFAQQKARLLG